MSTRVPTAHLGALTARHLRGHKIHPKLYSQTRRPTAPSRLRSSYEDEYDNFEIPETALGGAKE